MKRETPKDLNGKDLADEIPTVTVADNADMRRSMVLSNSGSGRRGGDSVLAASVSGIVPRSDQAETLLSVSPFVENTVLLARKSSIKHGLISVTNFSATELLSAEHNVPSLNIKKKHGIDGSID